MPIYLMNSKIICTTNISGGNLQNIAVSARNGIHIIKTFTLIQYHIVICSPWQRRRCSRCR